MRTREQVQSLIGKDLDQEFSLNAAAAILGIAYPTARRYAHKGYLRVLRRGNRLFVTAEELKRFNLHGNYEPGSPEAMVDEDAPKQEVAPISDLVKYTPEDGLNIDMLSDEQIASLSNNPHK